MKEVTMTMQERQREATMMRRIVIALGVYGFAAKTICRELGTRGIIRAPGTIYRVLSICGISVKMYRNGESVEAHAVIDSLLGATRKRRRHEVVFRRAM